MGIQIYATIINLHTGQQITDVNEQLFIGIDGKVYHTNGVSGIKDVSTDYRVNFQQTTISEIVQTNN